jgi:Icc-related predicted phosphoesterase
LIHAGDLTQSGTLKELQTSLDWLKTLPHQYKIVIAGNHDILLDSAGVVANASARASIDWGEMIYLNSSSKVLCINGRHINIYGSPLTPRHGNWAFQYPRNEDVWKDTIPRDTDILITHGPPKGHLDAGRLGCESLLNEVGRVKPKLHVFGHIHAGYGMERVQYDGLQSAYERTVVRGGGLWNLGRVLIELVKTYLFPGTIGSSRGVFVNAAIVGGLRDEQMRRPITVYI